MRITQATHHAAAISRLADDAFDIVYTDLLLPPPGWRVGEGFMVNSSTGEQRRFTDEDWRNWVIEEGGIDVVRRTRTLPGPNLRVPVVVMTTFVETLPYPRITRPLGYPDDPRIVLLPKFGSVEKLSTTLIAGLQPVVANLENDLHEALHLSLSGPWDVAHAQSVSAAAEQVRRRYRQGLRKSRLARAIPYTERQTPSRLSAATEVTCTLRVEIDPGSDVETLVELLGPASDEHELSVLYDDWPRLRDLVLLNPAIEVRLSIHVEVVGEPDHDPIDLDLFELASGPSVGHGDPVRDEHRLRQMLKQRLILVFLAASTEPPFELEEGWGATERDLLRIARDRSPESEHVQPWGSTEIELDTSGLLDEIANGIGFRDLLEGLTISLRQHTHRRKLYFDAESIVAPVKFPSGRGWFFNGGLELQLPTEYWHKPEGADQQRVAFFALADEVSFACLDGRLAAVDELELRFRNAGMDVERFNALEQVASLVDYQPDATLCVLAPVGEELLSSFVAGNARELWSAAHAASGPLPPTILVLNEDVSIRSPEDMARLREIDVDCMYPTQQRDALDLTKIMDHVICAGYRVRYQPLHADRDMPAERARARGVFTAAFEHVRALGYDGDSGSGAASERWTQDRILVTSSKTDKYSTDRDDVAIVDRVEFLGNCVHWSGERRPSSAIRWQWLIYERFPWAQCILHTHWKALTYNPALAEHRTARYRLSGSRMEAADLVRTLRSDDGQTAFGVLRDHGEVFVASSWDRLFGLVAEVQERIA